MLAGTVPRFLKRSADELGQFCFRVSLHKEGDEVTNGGIVKSVLDRSDNVLHGCWWYLGELGAEAIGDLLDHSVFFGVYSHCTSMRHRRDV